MSKSLPKEQFNLRLPHDLKQRLHAMAKENLRSLTSEIVMRLEASLRQDKTTMNKEDA